MHDTQNDCAKAEKYKKIKYLQDFLERRRYFILIVYSADGVTQVESFVAQGILAVLLRFNMKRENSELCGFVYASISIAIVTYKSLLLHGPQEK